MPPLRILALLLPLGGCAGADCDLTGGTATSTRGPSTLPAGCEVIEVDGGVATLGCEGGRVGFAVIGSGDRRDAP